MDFSDVLVVIPARYSSKRLPGKPLAMIAGKPMIVRTAEQCFKVLPRDRVIVATDDQRIVDVCTEHGIRAELTRTDHLTGTDRVAEVASRFPARTYINVQGDEPVFNPEDILEIIRASSVDRSMTYIGYCEISEREWRDSKYIKLLFGREGQLIYIGRAQVPGSHDGSFHVGYRQVCAYAYGAQALEAYSSTESRTPLESIEDCEVVRFLELGLPVRVIPMSDVSMSVDRPEDVARVERYLSATEASAAEAV